MNNKKTTIVRIPSDIQTYLRIAITNSYMEVYSGFNVWGEISCGQFIPKRHAKGPVFTFRRNTTSPRCLLAGISKSGSLLTKDSKNLAVSVPY